jgi:hypothetical protein
MAFQRLPSPQLLAGQVLICLGCRTVCQQTGIPGFLMGFAAYTEKEMEDAVGKLAALFRRL